MMDYTQLAALRAILKTGSFEAAAATLNVTPSAVSQRIKTLEERLGTVLIVRGTPTTATPAGQRLFRHAEEVALLESALNNDLDGKSPRQTTQLRVVVNADSLDTWFIKAISAVDGFLFDISTDDEGDSADWLRRGEVLAAVTAHGKPVQGCDSVALGALRYLATASPEFAARHFADGFTSASAKTAPMLAFNRKDHAQHHWLTAQFGKRLTPPLHLLPSTRGFVTAALAGIGWGLNPEPLVHDHIKAGRLVTLGDSPTYDVPLFWQFNRVARQALEPLTKAIIQTTRKQLELKL